MFGWLKATLNKLTGSQNRPLSLVANWLANVLWLIDTSFLGLAQKAYGSNAVVYACLRLLSQSVPEAPLLAYTVTGDTEAELPPTHPLRMLIARPNEMMTEYEFWELVTLQMGISGRSVWFKERDNAGHVIGLWPLRPDRVGPMYAAPKATTPADGRQAPGGNGQSPTRDGAIRVLWGYSYIDPTSNQPIPIPRTDVIAFNFPNPAGESGGIVEGLGPVQVLAHEISADNEATDFVGALLANYAMPTVALKVKAAIRDEAQAQLMKAQFRYEFGGAKRGSVAILDADTNIEQLGFNLRQLEFPDVRANAESRICAACGVPAILVGVKVGLDRSTFSNVRESRQFFAETTLSNYWRRYGDQYQNDVVAEFGENILVRFDTSSVRALAPRREQELAIAEKAFQLGATTRNEYRAALGLALVEGGDVFLVSGQTLAEPAGVPIKARVLEPPLLTAGDPLKKASDPREADEAALRVALEKLFGGFSDDMVARIRRGEGLPEDELRAELGRLLEPRLVEIAVAEGMRQGVTVGVSFDLPVVNEAAVSWARGYTYDLVGGLTETTRGVVQNAIGRFYETPGMVRAELEALLAPAFGPLRAEMIAITEVTRAYSAAQNDYQQMLGAQGIDMERVWVTRADEIAAQCPICYPLHMKPEEAWKGAHPSGPPAHVRCILGDTHVAPGGRIALYSKRVFEGDIVVIRTAAGDELSVTPNHPILGEGGWIAPQLLKPGNKIFRAANAQRVAAFIDPDYEHVPAAVEDIVASFVDDSRRVACRVPVSAEDFHGDGRDGEVDIVFADGELRRDADTELADKVGVLDFECGHTSLVPLAESMVYAIGDRHLRSAHGRMSRVGLAGALLGSETAPLQGLGLGLAADMATLKQQLASDDATADSYLLRNGVLRQAGLIELTDVVSVEFKGFRGHVYNLQTELGWFIGNNIITHNCRCSTTLRRRERVAVPAGAVESWLPLSDNEAVRPFMVSNERRRMYDSARATLNEYISGNRVVDPKFGEMPNPIDIRRIDMIGSFVTPKTVPGDVDLYIRIDPSQNILGLRRELGKMHLTWARDDAEGDKYLRGMIAYGRKQKGYGQGYDPVRVR